MTGSSGYGTSSESSRQPRFSTPGMSGSDEHGLSANLPSMLSSSSPSKDLVLESPETQTHVRPLSGNKAQGGAFSEHGAQIGVSSERREQTTHRRPEQARTRRTETHAAKNQGIKLSPLSRVVNGTPPLGPKQEVLFTIRAKTSGVTGKSTQESPRRPGRLSVLDKFKKKFKPLGNIKIFLLINQSCGEENILSYIKTLSLLKQLCMIQI